MASRPLYRWMHRVLTVLVLITIAWSVLHGAAIILGLMVGAVALIAFVAFPLIVGVSLIAAGPGGGAVLAIRCLVVLWTMSSRTAMQACRLAPIVGRHAVRWLLDSLALEALPDDVRRLHGPLRRSAHRHTHQRPPRA